MLSIRKKIARAFVSGELKSKHIKRTHLSKYCNAYLFVNFLSLLNLQKIRSSLKLIWNFCFSRKSLPAMQRYFSIQSRNSICSIYCEWLQCILCTSRRETIVRSLMPVCRLPRVILWYQPYNQPLQISATAKHVKGVIGKNNPAILWSDVANYWRMIKKSSFNKGLKLVWNETNSWTRNKHKHLNKLLKVPGSFH